jgi:arylsulfatase
MPHGFFNRSPWTEATARKTDEFLKSLGYLTGEPTLKLPAEAKELKKEEPAAAPAGAVRPPNVVLVFTDDMGYGDLACYGAKGVRTPNIDRMAQEGMRFTSFYVAQAVCTASRAALLTGCYSNRVSLFGALNHTSTTGIHDDELLLSELCKQRGYATALYGKWHLGHLPRFSPLRHGFDEHLSIPYPNDTSKYHPVIKNLPPLPLIDNDKVVALEPDQSQFTRMFTERAVQFIEKNRDRPFFLYVPHVMPHVPIFASEKFRGQSKLGLYGDVIEELDWSVGEILGAVKKNGLDERTLVIFTNDNGPFLSYGSHAGSSGPLRGGKLTTFEGGVRMPCIVRWPGMVPAGKTCDEIVTAMDLLPTVAGRIGGTLSTKAIDGKDVWPLLSGQPGAKSPHEAFFYYAGEQLQAVRSGDWKLHFPHPYLEVAGEPGRDGKPANFANLKPESIKLSGLEGIASRHGYKIEQIGLALYNLREDLGETKNVADKHPEIVRRLETLAAKTRADLGDSLTKQKGSGVRPPGRAEEK